MAIALPSRDPSSWLGKSFRVEIDRALGSCHPRFTDIRYALNYGYIPGTEAADGQPVDAYILGVSEAVTKFDGVCIAIIHRRTDIEDKLVIAPEGHVFDDAEILAETAFQERYFDVVLVR